jgi:hypothetical protein
MQRRCSNSAHCLTKVDACLHVSSSYAGNMVIRSLSKLTCCHIRAKMSYHTVSHVFPRPQQTHCQHVYTPRLPSRKNYLLHVQTRHCKVSNQQRLLRAAAFVDQSPVKTAASLISLFDSTMTLQLGSLLLLRLSHATMARATTATGLRTGLID